MTADDRFRRRLEGLLGIPATEGNTVEILRDGREIFPAMLEAIAQARHTVDLLTFVYWAGDIATQFAEQLIERARAGVRCRVILDALGARHIDEDLVGEMERAGVRVRWFRPLVKERWPGYRTHRKVLICDERIAFSGGVGIADEWNGSSDDGTGWRETQLRVRGPAVDGLRAAFADDWIEVGGALIEAHDRFPIHSQDGGVTAMVVRGESEWGYSDVALLRHILVESAQERVRITSAYLSPDETVISWLGDATDRGVQVQLLVPGPQTDKEIARLAAAHVYDDLLEAGVEIFEFQPTMLHAKVMTVDGSVAVVGSSNFNERSFRHDEEVDVVLLDHHLTSLLDAQTDDDLARCDRVVPGQWNDRSLPARGLQRLVGLIDYWI
jgi:cardiolipin synthase A/B